MLRNEAPRRPRILIVDDAPANIEVLAEALGDAYELFPATTPGRALALADQADLILLDVVMPELSGFEVCRRLKSLASQTRDVPVIFVTALGEVEDEARGFDAGGVDYITKPISPATVRARVRTHLDLRAAQRRLEREAATLTENLRLKEDVERLSRHDLKTPLQSVISIPQMILAKGSLSGPDARLLQVVETAGYRILDMVNRSLDLYRMETGTYAFEPARVNLKDVADRVIDDLRPMALAREVSIELEGQDAMAAAEELLTYSMIANLVKNAIEASDAGESTRVRTETGPEGASVSVRNAAAVPDGVRESFFRKYVSSGKRGGTGLGAYSARLMAETQRGRIALDTSKNRGTEIRVTLPAWSQVAVTTGGARAPEGPLSAGAGPPRAAPAHPTASLRDAVVVVGDDDEATRLILGKFLNGAGTVYFATNGDEVIQMTAAHDPAIVVLDAEMPGRDGWATARALRSMPRAGLRFVAGLTAHVEPETHRSLIEAGCDVVLEKPVSRERLLDALAKGRGRAGEARPGTAGAPGGVAASRSPDTAFAGTMVVEKDLLPLMPGFLASRRALARDLNDALGRADRAEALRLAHKLRGGFDMCGLVEIGQAFRDIEDQLRCDQDVRAVAARALALAASLETLRIEARSEHEGSES